MAPRRKDAVARHAEPQPADLAEEKPPQLVRILEKPHKRLEGLAYWFFYFPAVIVAMSFALLFIDLVERRLFNEED